jgi:hypothetical protein
MYATASCKGTAADRTLPILGRHLFIGLRDRRVLAQGLVALDGRQADHAVVEGRAGEEAPVVRIEAYVLKAGDCVYDLVYVAPPEAFPAWQPDFRAFVESFALAPEAAGAR